MSACLRFTRKVSSILQPILASYNGEAHRPLLPSSSSRSPARHSSAAQVFQDHLRIEGHDFNVLSQLKIVEARPGWVKATLLISERGLNRGKTLHGGVLASLTDTMGSLALSTHGLHSSGVSTDMGTTCVRSAGSTGDILSIQGEVVSLGRTLGFTRLEMRDAKERLVAFGHHTKFVGRCANPELDVKFDDDGEVVARPVP